MNFEKACKILDIEQKHLHCHVKRAYYKKALQLHPDKGGDENEFKKLNLAYQFLLSHNRYEDDCCDVQDNVDYSSLLKSALKWFDREGKWDDMFINTTFKNILFACENMSIEIFKKLSVEKSIKFLNIITKHHLIFSLKPETIEQMKEILRGKMNDNIIVLNTTLSDILEDKIYKLVIKENEYYIPLWHKYFYLKDENNAMVMNDILYDSNKNIKVKDNNDIWWKVNYKLQDIFDKGVLVLDIGNKTLKIYANELKLVKNQIITFKNQGILKVNKTNIYDTCNRANIYIELTLF